MTNADEILSIEREEILRDEVRTIINAKRASATKRTSIWDRLNSNFALWLLSAIVVSGGGTIYTQWYQAKQDAQKKEELATLELQRKNEIAAEELRKRINNRSRASLEISHRYSTTMTRLREIHERYQAGRPADIQGEIQSALSPLYGTPDKTFNALYDEFRTHSGIAVIGEMQRNAEPGEAEKLKEIIASASGALTKSYYSWGSKTLSVSAVASALAASMYNPDWDNGFPYTDCKSEKPFC